jgi:hypothetical protein
MVLIIHLVLALGSLTQASYLFFRPTRQGLIASYWLALLTFISGAYLVIASHSQLLSSCFSGVVYLATITALNLGARHKLAAQH